MPGGIYDSRMPEAHYDIIKPKVSQLSNVPCVWVTFVAHHITLSVNLYFHFYGCDITFYNVRSFNTIIYHPVPRYRVASSDS